HPEAWRWFLQIAGKAATQLRIQEKMLVESTDPGAGAVEKRAISKAFQVCALELERLSATGPAGLQQLRSIDMGTMLPGDGPRLMSDFVTVLESRDEGASILQNLSQVRVELKNSAGDAATVVFQTPGSDAREIDFVRVEGKWIPHMLAENWQAAI